MRWLGLVVMIACVSACDQDVSPCSSGRTNCEGRCVDLNTDSINCGSCGNICPTGANAAPGCYAGKCTIAACVRGFANCDGDPLNGCEGRLGACNCSMGFADCHNPQDGCDTPTTSDRNNCGACFNVCP